MNKSESKYFNTARLMDEAFLQLLEKKDYPFISVKEVCEKAGVNRSTFYLHYESMDDLLSEAVEYMNQDFISYMNKDGEGFVHKIKKAPLKELYLVTPEYLNPYLMYIKEHKRVFKTALEKGNSIQAEDTYEKLFIHVLQPILERFSIPKEEQRYIQSFYIQGMMAVINIWIKNDCQDTIDHIVAIIMKCVKYE